MPVTNNVGSPGYSASLTAPLLRETPHLQTGGFPTAEFRASDIPSSQSARAAEPLEGEAVDASRLQSISREKQTPAQREATKATAESPSLLKRICTGLTGLLCGAVGGVGAGLYAGGALVRFTAETFSSAPPVAFVGACIAGVAGLALVGIGALGGAVAGAVHGARTGEFRKAAEAIAFPVNFVSDWYNAKPKDDSAAAAPT